MRDLCFFMWDASSSRLLQGQMIYDREMLIPLFCACAGGEKEAEKERKKERKRGPSSHRFFCCFSFHLSALLLGSSGTRWALFLTPSVCHFLLQAAKKNPTYAQLRLVSPPRQINGVSASACKVISGG